MIYSFFLYSWLVASVLLIITVLLHSPKGDGMGGIATGAGGTMFTSARSAENMLNRITWTLVAVFLVVAVALSAGWLQRVEPAGDNAQAEAQSSAASPAEPLQAQPVQTSLSDREAE